MAETLDSLAEKISSLASSIDKRFDAVDERFVAVDQRFDAVDQRFDEIKAELRTEIEAVDAKVGLVLEKMDDLTKRDIHHSIVHARLELRLENHDLRLKALESGKTTA